MSTMLVREIAMANIMIFSENPKESRDYSGRWPRPLRGRSRQKRSKPVRSAEAALTRFGSVLRGTDAPLRTPLMAAPLQDSSLRARRSGQRLADVPRRASRIKGNKVKRLCPGKPATDSCWFIPPAPDMNPKSWTVNNRFLYTMSSVLYRTHSV